MKRRKVGPFSKRLSFAMLDLRTQEGATPATLEEQTQHPQID